MIVFNPIVNPSTRRRLVETIGWNEPQQLAAEYIRDVRECSGGWVNYQIVEHVEADAIPVKADGFQYRVPDYLAAWRNSRGFHDPDLADYAAIVRNFHLLERVANDEFDEVWMFGGPYFGFYESTMAGRGAFFCNSSPVPNTSNCARRFVMMGFNYERGVGEMLEDLGHRVESVMTQVYRGKIGAANLFERFTRYDRIAPGLASVGNVHFAPNSARDYDWGNPRAVPSFCDDWYAFPNLPDPPRYRMVDAREWGGGDMRAHHRWWLKHLPRAEGTTNGIANNWWKYVIDVNDPLFESRR